MVYSLSGMSESLELISKVAGCVGCNFMVGASHMDSTCRLLQCRRVKKAYEVHNML